jgi:prepilin-type N-terminal cleavage/methylation domain-containing protein
MRHHPRTTRAFTLIELLTVIAIIGVLAALLFPAIKSALLKAEITKAQSGITNISIALRSYYTEYGKWPISDTRGPGWNYVVDANMALLLSGSNVVNSPGNTFVPTQESNGNASPSPQATFQGNPRSIAFLQFKQSDLGNSPSCVGCYLDPWKKPYYFALDLNYANVVQDPFVPTPFLMITNGFLVWSDGPDNQESATAGEGVGVNKDNVKSW